MQITSGIWALAGDFVLSLLLFSRGSVSRINAKCMVLARFLEFGWFALHTCFTEHHWYLGAGFDYFEKMNEKAHSNDTGD